MNRCIRCGKTLTKEESTFCKKCEKKMEKWKQKKMMNMDEVKRIMDMILYEVTSEETTALGRMRNNKDQIETVLSIVKMREGFTVEELSFLQELRNEINDLLNNLINITKNEDTKEK